MPRKTKFILQCAAGLTCLGSGYFTETRASKLDRRRYCSPKCQYAHQGAVARSRNPNPAPKTLINRTYADRHPERVRAQRRSGYMRECGVLPPVATCGMCDEDKPVQYHHPDYSRPDFVVPLCPGCHRDEHKRQRQDQGQRQQLGAT